MLFRTKTALFIIATIALMVSRTDELKAGSISVTSYDIDRGREGGFGGWQNTYTGTVTLNGDGTFHYSSGSGTLNDGILPTDTSNSLLYNFNDHSVTTLHLGGGLSTISKIDIFGFANGNFLPGIIDTVLISINGVSDTIRATNFGPNNPYNGLGGVNQELDLSGSILCTMATSVIDIKIISTHYDFPFYQIGEITIDGNSSVVSPAPEPASMSLLAAGALGMLGYRMRKRKMEVAAAA